VGVPSGQSLMLERVFRCRRTYRQAFRAAKRARQLIAGHLRERYPMSAYGTKQTLRSALGMSAFGGKADMVL
jgi:Mg2+ and Co2+ transporter CorA